LISCQPFIAKQKDLLGQVGGIGMGIGYKAGELSQVEWVVKEPTNRQIKDFSQ